MAAKFLLLFNRPGEPIFLQISDDNKVVKCPTDYLDNRYHTLHESMCLATTPAGGETEHITVNKIKPPDLCFPEKLPKDSRFSLFIPLHKKMADQLIKIFMAIKGLDDLWSVAVYARLKINSQLFNYALSVALLHRPETRDLPIPSLNESFPDKFFDCQTMNRAREEIGIFKDPSQRIPVEITRDFSGSDLDVEHRLYYFREDIGVNLHHWHWHLVYPNTGPENVVKKDRRGELFFYMHSQILARYNMDRLCNQLSRVTRLMNLRDPIPEAYYPSLDNKISSHNWPGRSCNTVLRDINRPTEELYFDIQDLERWRNRIFDAIHQGFVIDTNDEKVMLTEKDGIDILGNILESSILSKNRRFYGDLHNSIHIAIAYIHDPDFRHLQSHNVMGDSATAMRDPIFYRVHSTVDDIFQKYKSTLNPYTEEELNFHTVTVTNVSVQVEGNGKNQLFTHWQQSDVNLSRGMDFSQKGAAYARITHLQHADFTYTIEVKNEGEKKKGTARIFIAPIYDERGIEFLFGEQRKLFVELDRFTIDIEHGRHKFTRKSTESSVTIPFERSFRNLNSDRPDAKEEEALSKFNFCGCGWPHHMLLAKGTKEGYQCQLFVMISNHADDKVEQELGCEDCTDAMSYCGIRDKLWPDRRQMGFPFDREARKGCYSLEHFLTQNMKTTEVKIKHKDHVDKSKLQPNPTYKMV